MARFLGIFCLHEWEETERYGLYLASRVTPSAPKAMVGVKVHQACKLCGKVRAVKL